MTAATPDDLLVLAGLWGAMCLTFLVAGAVADPGGLWDRVCEWLGLDDVPPEELVVRDLRAGEGRP